MVDLSPELLAEATPAELAEIERLLLAQLATVDDGPALIGDIDPDNPPATPGMLAAALTQGREAQRPHLDLIDEVMLRAERQGGQRILLNIGPRYGKTRRVTWGCAHRLTRRPETRIIYASHGKRLAEAQTRWARDLLETHDLGVKVRQDTRAADRWYLDGADGGMLAVGIGGGITGFGADLLVIDDVIKDDKQAYSPTWREAVWRWYTQTAFDRLEPGASVVIVMTRWHDDDLAGRLLREQPGVWTHIRVPTVAEDDDPIDRQTGELLWPERYDETAVAEQKKTLGSQGFAARHQQRPAPLEGAVFKKDWLRYFTVAPGGYDVGGRWEYDEHVRRFSTCDLAVSTKASADWTVIATWGVTATKDLLLLDVVRERMEGPDIVPALRRVFDRWHPVSIGVEQVAFQLSIVQSAQRAGLPVVALRPDRDKVSRAMTAAARMEARTVYFLKDAAWLSEFEDELLRFPAGRNDDQVDVLSYAAAQVTLGRWSGGVDDPGAAVVAYEGIDDESLSYEPARW